MRLNMLILTFVLMFTATVAGAEPLPQPKPPGPGGSLPARLHIVGILLCAEPRRTGRNR
jgi:hypothetical protein